MLSCRCFKSYSSIAQCFFWNNLSCSLTLVTLKRHLSDFLFTSRYVVFEANMTPGHGLWNLLPHVFTWIFPYVDFHKQTPSITLHYLLRNHRKSMNAFCTQQTKLDCVTAFARVIVTERAAIRLLEWIIQSPITHRRRGSQIHMNALYKYSCGVSEYSTNFLELSTKHTLPPRRLPTQLYVQLTIPYHTCTYSRLPEDEPSGSKHVEDIVKVTILV